MRLFLLREVDLAEGEGASSGDLSGGWILVLVREAQLGPRDLDSIWAVVTGEGENQGR